MRVTIAQINPTVGDLEGNFRIIEKAVARAGLDSSDLVVFPELTTIGYPPQDLLERPWFVEQTQRYLEKVVALSERYDGLGILIGTPTFSAEAGKSLHNSAVLIYRGAVLAERHKSLLPSYDVFDETRYFEPAVHNLPVNFKDQRLGINICEDAWNDPAFWPAQLPYRSDPIRLLADAGATVFINLSASPFHAGKEELRYRLISNHAQRHKIPFIYVNQVGGNDELIFDGHSLIVDGQGEMLAFAAGFREDIQTFDLNAPGRTLLYSPEDEISSIYNALVLGLRDYVHKSGFSKTILGLSGGIDSSLTACLAVAALGRDNVLGVAMPSQFSSAASLEDAEALARNLGINLHTIPITGVFQAYLDTLSPYFSGSYDTTEENIQARIRGNYLMAFSNKFAYLVLSTGNKSEIAMGYCTLYGDMSGGLSVLADVPKTMVYELSRFCNRDAELIPARVLVKAPSAELRFNQTDQDTLPPYDILDQILYLYIEQCESAAGIIARGFDAETVRHIITVVDRNEYKRRQAAPGLKITSKAFGTGRRMPIVQSIKHPPS
jgi:NAD+ synthase (glutamine-hydrolysing)